MKSSKIKIIFFVSLLFILGFLSISNASAFSEGELRNFYIDSSYDLYGREDIEAYLIRTTDSLYFYIEKNWWDINLPQEQNNIKSELYDLGKEFKNKIYPILTSTFGSEWKPGIDGDNRVTVLIHPMKKNRGGYFRTGDEYSKFTVTTSNKREMVYLSSGYITSSLNKSFLAHEFMHLITFNQKNRIQSAEEETWLNEARAEAASTLLGYDSEYKGSNLQQRVNEFLNNPSDSITGWQGSSADYGALNLFTQYLVDHYGVEVLSDSLQSPETGIASINSALRKNGFQEDFSQVFIDWTVAVLVNDCDLGNRYCYKNPDLKNLRIVPESNYLPFSAESTLMFYSQIKDWSAKWQKIFGGKGGLILKFEGKEGIKIKIPYVLCDYTNDCLVKFLNLNNQQKGEIVISDFSSNYNSLTLIPSVQQRLSGFTENEPTYSFFLEINSKELLQDDPELIKNLLEQISALKAEITRLKALINAILSGQSSSYSCSGIENNLYFGIRNSAEVRCLQEFLKSQGTDIYPEGLVTGNFLFLTQSAVIRFQEKYSSEILAPLDLSKGTGYVGPLTRAKINQLAGF